LASGKAKKKNETFCRKIVAILSDNNINPVETDIDKTSFRIIYKYAKGSLGIIGANIDNNKTREAMIFYESHVLSLKKSHCTLKNITDVLITVFRKDNLPRCPKCGSRPHYYHEYEYGSFEIGTDNSSQPMWDRSLFFNPPKRNTEVSTYVIAECCCGNQWKLNDFCSVYDIYYAYKEGNK